MPSPGVALGLNRPPSTTYGKLPVYCHEPGRVANQEYLKLIKAYTLGNKLMDTGFQNAAIDAIVEKSHSVASDGKRYYPVAEVVKFAYNDKNTHASAPIRRLLVDMHVSVGSGTFQNVRRATHILILLLSIL